jgi:RNA 2',3'-cyclic 3'-phosphodiesterase
MRTFLSLNLDDDTKKKIIEIQNEIREEVTRTNSKYIELMKWEPVDKFHMTLFFIGEVDEEELEVIDSKLSLLESRVRLNQINFKMNGIDAFPKLRFSRVLILDLLNEDNKAFIIAEMIKDVLMSIGIKAEKNFRPHITLARIKRDHNLNFMKLKDKFNFDYGFSVKNFYLMKSDLKTTGSEYSIVKEYNLGQH